MWEGNVVLKFHLIDFPQRDASGSKNLLLLIRVERYASWFI